MSGRKQIHKGIYQLQSKSEGTNQKRLKKGNEAGTGNNARTM